MIKLFVLSILFLVFTRPLEADSNMSPPEGWHWYNEPAAKQTKRAQPDFNKMTATEQMAIYHKGLKDALAEATLYPTMQNVRAYLELQKFAGDQAGKFAGMYEPVLLQNPDLDYEVDHPTSTAASALINHQYFSDQGLAIKSLAETHGIIFFYQGSNKLDLLMSKIVHDFVTQYGVAVIPVSVDGKISPYFKDNTRMNQGQSERMGIHYFPAVVLVDPKTGEVEPVSYGFLSESDLASRFLDIAMKFKTRY